jgi:2'-5' RNA ligase
MTSVRADPPGRQNGRVQPTQSALIIGIPEAEPAVGDLRARYDTAATWGVPAHITLLYPFVRPASIDVEVLSLLQDLIWTIPRFDIVLTRIGWFGDKVLWLGPDPDEPLRVLTTALSTTFGLRPYGGAHTDVIPHLTVAHDHPLTAMRRAATQVQRQLPIHTTVDRVQLITGRPEPGPSWRTVSEFPLG